MIGLDRLGAEAWRFTPGASCDRKQTRPRHLSRDLGSGRAVPSPACERKHPGQGRAGNGPVRRGRRGAGRGGPGAGAYSPAREDAGLARFVRCVTTGPVFLNGPAREGPPRVETRRRDRTRGRSLWRRYASFARTRLPIRGCSSTSAQRDSEASWTALRCAARREASSLAWAASKASTAVPAARSASLAPAPGRSPRLAAYARRVPTVILPRDWEPPSSSPLGGPIRQGRAASLMAGVPVRVLFRRGLVERDGGGA